METISERDSLLEKKWEKKKWLKTQNTEHSFLFTQNGA